MPSLKDIKTKISSVKSTQKITKAMKMISTARLNRSKINLVNHKEYAVATRSFFNSISSSINKELENAPAILRNFTQKAKEQKTLCVLISTDKGLCGALNTMLFKEFTHNFSSNELLFTIGKKAFDFSKSRFESLNQHPHLSSKTELHNDIIEALILEVRKHNITKIKIFFPQFISTMVQKPSITTFPQEEKQFDQPEYIVEGCSISLCVKAIEENIRGLIQESLSNLLCSEHSARMIAMDSATNNATQRIKSLTLTYNKTRQANITREILEIVAGSQAI